MSLAKYVALVISVLVAWIIGHQVARLPLKSSLLRRSYIEVCHLVDQNFYKTTPEFKTWLSDCYRAALNYPLKSDLDVWLVAVRRQLEDLGVSHLDIWDPDSTRATFLGQAKETGVRVRQIEGRFVVIQLVEDAPGVRAGLQVGDEIQAIDNVLPSSPDAVVRTPGVFRVLRKKQILQVPVGAEVVTVDLSPRLEWDESGVALLQIPTFSRFYLQRESWLATVQSLQDAPGIVLDLRGNPGGDFVAMIRVLSTFRCDLKNFGHMTKARSDSQSGLQESVFPEGTVDEETQMMAESNRVTLKRFGDYPCLANPMVILVDGRSASTSEILAQVLKSRAKTKVLGDFTEGSVLTTSFFALPLGELYRLTIPVAMYTTPEGDELEGIGVRPHRVLKYRLDEAHRGEDTWLNAAIKEVLSR